MSRQTRLKRQLTWLYSGTAVTIGTLLVGSAIALPQGAIAQANPQDTRIAQLFYPPAAGPQIIAVTGQGYAKVPADLAQINVVVTNQKSPEPYPDPAASPPGKRPPEPEPITAASLEGIVQALQAAGVSRDKIKVNVNPINPSRSYFNRSTSSVSVDLSQPTPERVGQIVKAVNTVFQKDGDKAKIFLENVYVQYIVTSCEAVENAAYASAMQDAKLRATAVAKAMGVQLATSPSVAELPFLGRFNTPCSQERDVVGTVFRRPPYSYDPSTPAIVEVYRELAVTYRLQ
jgi:hypothetical protein